ncbi:DUF4339 domain-containing protein [bacterium]|nr:DUF4339 domain-containing protein [bacterium]
MKAWHAAGQILAEALIWREGMNKWMPWHQVAELVSEPKLVTVGIPASAANPVAGQPYALHATNPYAGGMGGGLGMKPPNYLW